MRYYNIEVDYRKNGSPTYSMTCDEDYVVENVSFEEMCYHMRSVVNKYVEEGKISKTTGYDMRLCSFWIVEDSKVRVRSEKSTLLQKIGTRCFEHKACFRFRK